MPNEIQLREKTRESNGTSPLVESIQPYFMRLANELKNVMNCSWDFVVAADNDEDSKIKLFRQSEKMANQIHCLIQICAMNSYDEKPATLGKSVEMTDFIFWLYSGQSN